MTRLTGDEYVQEMALEAIAHFDALTKMYAAATALGQSPAFIAEMETTRLWQYIAAAEEAAEQITNEYQTVTNQKAVAIAHARYIRTRDKALHVA